MILLLNEMNGGSASIGVVAIIIIIGSMYEAYLQGQDLWDLIEGDDTEI